jgi:hypothetical protein
VGGFDSDLTEDLKCHKVNYSTKFAKCAQILKNSVASKETTSEKASLMMDRAAVEEAVGLWGEWWWNGM